MENLSKTMSQEDLDRYFSNHLPEGVTFDEFQSGYSCYRDARLLVMALGGPDKARIFWYEEFDGEGEIIDSHAYVVVTQEEDDELSYGNEVYPHRTNGFLRKHGEDLTDEIFSAPWNMT